MTQRHIKQFLLGCMLTGVGLVTTCWMAYDAHARHKETAAVRGH